MFGLNPIEELEETYLDPDFIGECLELPEDPKLFNGVFPPLETHICIDLTKVSESTDFYWHLCSQLAGRYVYNCSKTGSSLAVKLQQFVFNEQCVATFRQSEIDARVAKQTEYSATTTHDAWKLVERIINDVLTDTGNPLAISTEKKKAVVYLDVHAVLPALGFVFDADTKRYVSPKRDREAISLLRCALVETRLHLGCERKPLSQGLATFFSTPNRHSHLSLPCFGTLGAVDSYSEEQLVSMYKQQKHSDPKGAPWYLEALQTVAEKLNSEFLQTVCAEQLSLGVLQLRDVKTSLLPYLDPISARSEPGEQVVMLAFTRIFDPDAFLKAACAVNGSESIREAVQLTNMTLNEAEKILDVLYIENEAEVNAKVAEIGDEVRKLDQTDTQNGYVGLEMRLAVRELGLATRKPFILTAFEEMSPEYPISFTVSEAAAKLNVSSDVNDEMLCSLFTSYFEDCSNADLFVYRACLKTFILDRRSATLAKLLTGKSVQRETEGAWRPVGLNNIGNSCYLSSLLQFYFSISSIRNFTIDFASTRDEERRNAQLEASKQEEQNSMLIDMTNEPNPDLKLANTAAQPPATPEHPVLRKIGGRNVPLNEVKRSELFVHLLGSLFREMASTNEESISPSVILGYMALVPPHVYADDDTLAVYSSRDVPQVIRNRFQAAACSQEDVTECIDNVLFQLEATLKPTRTAEDGEQEDLVKELFYGSTVQTLQRVADGGNKRTKHERFSTLLLNVGTEPTDIYESLDSFFADDTMDLEEGQTLRTLRIAKLPKYLQVQVQRALIDPVSWRPYKNENALVFNETVYLDRYLDNDPNSAIAEKWAENKKLRVELNALKAQLNSLAATVKDRRSLRFASEYLQPHYKDSESELSDCSSDEDSLSEESMVKVEVSHEDMDVERRAFDPKAYSYSDSDSDDMDSESQQDVQQDAQQNHQQNHQQNRALTAKPTVVYNTPTPVPSQPLVSQATIEAIDTVAGRLDAELSALETQIRDLESKIAHQFDGMQSKAYRVHAVFIHRGDVSYGHYWIYIRDPETDQFFQYNDERVTPADKDEVFDFSKQNKATPYFVVFKEVDSDV